MKRKKKKRGKLAETKVRKRTKRPVPDIDDAGVAAAKVGALRAKAEKAVELMLSELEDDSVQPALKVVQRNRELGPPGPPFDMVALYKRSAVVAMEQLHHKSPVVQARAMRVINAIRRDQIRERGQEIALQQSAIDAMSAIQMAKLDAGAMTAQAGATEDVFASMLEKCVKVAEKVADAKIAEFKRGEDRDKAQPGG